MIISDQERADREDDADQSGRIHGSALLSAREGHDRGDAGGVLGAAVGGGGTRRGPSRRRWRGSPARYSRISWSTSSTVSVTTYLVPSTRKATVSGCASTRSIRSGLSANCSPFRRVTRITVRSSCSMGPAVGRGTALFSSAHRGLPLSRTARSAGRQARDAAENAAARSPRGVTGPRACEPASSQLTQRLRLTRSWRISSEAGDHAAVRLEAALGDDQAGELLGEVDVRHLQRAAT